MKHILICKNCGKEYQRNYKSIFCCVKCSITYNKRECKLGGDRGSLKYFQNRFGKEVGLKKFEERNKKLSEQNKNKPSPMKGKKHSKFSKDKISFSVKSSEYHKELRESGRTDDDKQRIAKYMKGVFSLDWFIKKYGDKQGKRLYEERSLNISKSSYFKEFNKTNKNNFSKKSQKLFWYLFKRLCLENQNVYFAELNHEFSCGTEFNFDFVWLDKRKVIEFNGNIWHANPEMFGESDKPNPYSEMSSGEIWKNDRFKIQKAQSRGFTVLVVWEKDFDKNENETIRKCIEFLVT